jgi:murein DD-endopeptidase MepM/ murein hydrolase activator NlpD
MKLIIENWRDYLAESKTDISYLITQPYELTKDYLTFDELLSDLRSEFKVEAGRGVFDSPKVKDRLLSNLKSRINFDRKLPFFMGQPYPKEVQISPPKTAGVVIGVPVFLKNPMPDGVPSKTARFAQSRTVGQSSARKTVGHGALDILGNTGLPVLAAGAGKVVRVITIPTWMRSAKRIANYWFKFKQKGEGQEGEFADWFRSNVKLEKITLDVDGWDYLRGILRKGGDPKNNIFRNAPGNSLYKAGAFLIIQHNKFFGGTIETKYMHLNEIDDDVSKGAFVQTGETIGKSGNTSIVTSRNHLHYAVFDGGKAVDPELYTVGLNR